MIIQNDKKINFFGDMELAELKVQTSLNRENNENNEKYKIIELNGEYELYEIN